MWPFKSRKKEEKPRRCHVKDVKPGEFIYIEWNRIHGNIGRVKCLANDPETQRILIEVNWSNIEPSVEQVIFKYNSEELKNFHLLNMVDRLDTTTEEDKSPLEELQKKLKEAISIENYEEAEILKKKIEKSKQK